MRTVPGAHRAKRLAAAAAALVLLASLTGCQYLDRTAVRLSSDGSLHVVSCETLDELSSAEIEYYVRAGDDPPVTVAAVAPPRSLDEGTVIDFGAVPPPDVWDRVSFSMVGDDGWTVSGIFDRASMKVDEWVWANQGFLYLFADVEHCEILD
jgi:hypothetical protein